MATITVNATQDGYLMGVGNTSFADARTSGGEAASAFANPTSANAESIEFSKIPGGRGTSYFFRRSAFGFNVTSYSSDTITNAYLQIRTTTTGTNLANTLYMVPFSGFGGTLGDSLEVGDWANYTLGTSWGNESISNTATTQTLTLNSTGIAAFTTGYVKIGLISNVDYQNSNPAAEEQFDDTFLNWSHSDNARLIFDQEGEGYDYEVNGIIPANQSKINGIAVASINTINNEPFTP
mgnify:CR=1 FL=1